ncbi:MAG: PAS domain S-box protein [Anaerolineales bacterium]|nr:MAG: PAS domain S-box protein [Anaerolineales bacterium]
MEPNLLEQLLKKLQLESTQVPDLEIWQEFLREIERTYSDKENELALLERSNTSSSKEMQELYDDLKQTSEMQYRLIFEGVQDAILVLASDGMILDCNSRSNEMFGWDKDALHGKNLTSLVSSEFSDVVMEELRARDLTDSPYEALGVRLDGEHFPVEITARHQTLNDIYVILVVIRDISERKHGEEALRESEAKFRNLAEKSPSMIFINKDGRIVYANEACVKIMGYSREDLYHEDFNFLQLIAPEDQENILEHYRAHLASEEVPQYESQLVTKDGRRLSAIHATRLIPYGGETAILGVVTDVSDRILAEKEQRQRATEMELLNEIGGEIASVLNLDNVLERSVKLVQERFNYDHVGLFLHNLETGFLVLKARAGQYAPLFPDEHRLQIGKGMVGWAAGSYKTILSNNVETEPHYINPFPDLIRTQSELSIPITAGEALLGVLDIQSEKLNAFEDHDRIVMETLVDQIAAAIENARLYEAAQRELRERKRAEGQILLQATALESAANAIVITDREGRILWINRAFELLTGFPAEEIAGKDMRILNSDTQDDAFFKEMWETILAGRTWHGKMVNVRKDGAKYIEEQTITPVRDETGEITHFIAIKQDITDRTEAEERIEQQAEDLQLLSALNERINLGDTVHDIVEFLSNESIDIFNSLGVTIYLLSEDEKFLEAQNLSLPTSLINRIEEKIKVKITNHRLKIKTDSEIGKILDSQNPLLVNGADGINKIFNEFVDLIDLPITNLASISKKLFPPILNLIKVQSIILIPLSAEGRSIGLLIMGRTKPFTDNDQARIVSVANQVTRAIKRKRTEEALRQSESNYRNVFEGVQDAIFVESMDGKILDINSRTCEMYEWSREELLMMTVEDLIPEGHPVVLPREMVARGLSDQMLSTMNIRSSGEIFPVEISVKLQKWGDQDVMLVVVRDVTEAQQAQKRALLQDRLAAVGQLAAGIAHDFNNILGTIMLYSELLLSDQSISSKSKERIDTIFKQAKRGSTLTTQVLDFSRRSIMEKHPFDLVPFFTDLEKLLSRTLPENVKINMDFNGESGYFINADPTRMQQVIMNLALNARDAMPKGGELCFTLDELDVKDGQPPYPGMHAGSWVRIRVSDTGLGIDPDVMLHIFEPFFTTKPQGKGTGLGLSQVYGIVKQHSGFIDAESTPGKGTTFMIYLPAIDEQVTTDDTTGEIQTQMGRGETILVVEDDDATRNAIGEILESQGYTIFFAKDGAVALSELEALGGAVELIISDLVMPNMGGRDLYDEVSARYPNIKMVLITGYPLGGHTRELLDRQRVTWLQKPLTSETLAQRVQFMLKTENLAV